MKDVMAFVALSPSNCLLGNMRQKAGLHLKTKTSCREVYRIMNQLQIIFELGPYSIGIFIHFIRVFILTHVTFMRDTRHMHFIHVLCFVIFDKEKKSWKRDEMHIYVDRSTFRASWFNIIRRKLYRAGCNFYSNSKVFLSTSEFAIWFSTKSHKPWFLLKWV